MAGPTTEMQRFREVLKTSKGIIAVTGAGLSAASGIPTFRGQGGFWRKYNAMKLATPSSFAMNPSVVWQFYHYRREVALTASPNAAHNALSLLSLPSIRNELGIPPDATFYHITQNVDGLAMRSLTSVGEAHGSSSLLPSEPDTGSLIEMHGRLFDVLCDDESCGHVEFNTSSPICPALEGTEALLTSATSSPNPGPTITEKDLPRCSKCGGLARPGVVWFGEVPHKLLEIDDLVEEADLCLVVGTSSTVTPASSYAAEVQEHGGKVAVFNIERSKGDSDADFLFLGPCEETLVEALQLESHVEALKGKVAESPAVG